LAEIAGNFRNRALDVLRLGNIELQTGSSTFRVMGAWCEGSWPWGRLGGV